MMDCQVWIMEYLRLLVERNYIDAEAVNLAEAQQEPSGLGICLKAVGRPPQDAGEAVRQAGDRPGN
ncbi:hypothetical protein SLS62_009922 [Diatrype stigma]|uniref:Uncharacterized protein n=1 Tax=Diatrype stigma TaxID=117547 RepID=A0AAN9UCK1_9PEZI